MGRFEPSQPRSPDWARAIALEKDTVEHTVTVEVAATAWEEDDHLVDLLVALDARPELLGPAVAGDVHRRIVAVTVTLEAPTAKIARELANRALLEEMLSLGLV